MSAQEFIESDAPRGEPGAADIRPPVSPDTPVSPASAHLFAEHLRRGAKPAAEWLCGVELELFGYDARDPHAPARLDPAAVASLLVEFASGPGDLGYEGGQLTETVNARGGRVTVEPGGQIEFSGSARRALSEIAGEIEANLTRLRSLAAERGYVFLAAGFDPLCTLREQRWFPKRRYGVMRPYLATRGARAWDMMTRTCSVQVNLDYDSDRDLARKYLAGNRLAPFVTAAFANSPFADGRPSGYKSTRAAAWLATDDDRTGAPAIACGGGDELTPEQFVAYALEVPMLFARRGGAYSDEATGVKFGDFLAGRCPSLRPVFGDWPDHLSTIFTDARLKQYVELRSADCGDAASALACAALWKGLLYDGDALEEALRLAPRLGRAESSELRAAVARDALEARACDVPVKELTKEIVALAREGLGRVAPGEVHLLDALAARVLEDGVSPADILLRDWHGRWHGSMRRVFDSLRVA
ncbi:MAG: glutamate--cysteine ligase [Acidobacteria bacterium]|nr:glutamate--cysteine ligase [Acidobacteriota bacterium]